MNESLCDCVHRCNPGLLPERDRTRPTCFVCTNFSSRLRNTQTTLNSRGTTSQPQGLVWSKVAAINTWPPPKTVKELQRFLGFANFQRRFIWGYSLITAPFTSLLRGQQRTLQWNSKAATAFAQLKRDFVTTLVLTLPNPSFPFLVEVDAANTGVGAVLLSSSPRDPARLHVSIHVPSTPRSFPRQSRITTSTTVSSWP